MFLTSVLLHIYSHIYVLLLEYLHDRGLFRSERPGPRGARPGAGGTLCVCIYTYVCVYIYIYIYICTCVYIYIYIHIYNACVYNAALL